MTMGKYGFISGVVGLMLFFLIAPVYGSTTVSSQEAIVFMTRMMKSMDHIQTFRADVTLSKQSQDKSVSINYRLVADNIGDAVVFIDTKPKRIEIQNTRGHFVIQRGDAVKAKTPFPFDIPFRYFKKMSLGEVTDNYKFVVSQHTDEIIAVDMIPIGTGGRSVKDSFNADVPTMIRFEMDPVSYYPKQISIFKKHQQTTQDVVRFSYGAVINKTLEMAGSFENQVTKIQKQSIVRTKSVADLGVNEKGAKKFQIKEAVYQNIVLNDVLKDDIFDERAY